MTINFSFQDLNDNSPAFVTSSVTVSKMETVPIGEPIADMDATDLDPQVIGRNIELNKLFQIWFSPLCLSWSSRSCFLHISSYCLILIKYSVICLSGHFQWAAGVQHPECSSPLWIRIILHQSKQWSSDYQPGTGLRSQQTSSIPGNVWK